MRILALVISLVMMSVIHANPSQDSQNPRVTIFGDRSVTAPVQKTESMAGIQRDSCRNCKISMKPIKPQIFMKNSK